MMQNLIVIILFYKLQKFCTKISYWANYFHYFPSSFLFDVQEMQKIINLRNCTKADIF